MNANFSYIGKRIQIIGNHPHSGEKGIIKDIQTTAFGSTGLVIELEDCQHGTDSCFVFNGKNIKFLG